MRPSLATSISRYASAEAVAGNQIRSDAVLAQDRKGRDRSGQNRRLGVGRQLEILLGAVEAHSAQAES